MLNNQRERSELTTAIAACNDPAVRTALRKAALQSFLLAFGLVLRPPVGCVFPRSTRIYYIIHYTTTQLCKHRSCTVFRVPGHIDEVPDGQNAGKRSLLLF